MFINECNFAVVVSGEEAAQMVLQEEGSWIAGLREQGPDLFSLQREPGDIQRALESLRSEQTTRGTVDESNLGEFHKTILNTGIFLTELHCVNTVC